MIYKGDFEDFVELNYVSYFQRYLALGTNRPTADKLTMERLKEEWIDLHKRRV